MRYFNISHSGVTDSLSNLTVLSGSLLLSLGNFHLLCFALEALDWTTGQTSEVFSSIQSFWALAEP